MASWTASRKWSSTTPSGLPPSRHWEWGDLAGEHPIAVDADLARVRAVPWQAAREAGLGVVAEASLMTADSELACNVLNHPHGGWCGLEMPGDGVPASAPCSSTPGPGSPTW